MKIIAIYYSQKYADCYTVYFNHIEKIESGKIFYLCLAMDSKPFHPQGIGQHSCGQLGKHNGHKITFSALPPDCQKLVNQEME